MVSIARVVSLGARVVILDEPTSALSSGEVEQLIGVVEQLRAEGVGLVYVSHRLSEIYRLCDRMTVLRDGRQVVTATPAELPRPRLIAAMLGRELAAEARTASNRDGASAAASGAAATAPPALEVGTLDWRTRVRNVSFTVQRGEILGLAGLLGAGRTETMKAVYGAEKPEGGTVSVAGRRLSRHRPSESLRTGLAFLSEDRRTEGIFPRLSVRENLTASVLPQISRFGVISRRKQDALVGRFIGELGIKTSGPGAAITELSGGNQQKVLIARALCTGPKAVMLDDPTRGIDVGAKAEVHRAVRALAEQGLGIVVTSSDVEEVVDLADRLVVLDEGAVAGSIDTEGRDPDDVLALLAGGSVPDASAGAPTGAAP
jgi:galactofuranose transport system ATP-binding protein